MLRRSNARRLVALLAVATATVFMIGTTSAASLLLNMSTDEVLRWEWSPSGPLKGPVYRLVLSEDEARRLTDKLPTPLAESLKGIDYERQAAIVAYLGEAPNSGYQVAIHSVQVTDSGIVVNVSRRSPAADQLNASVISYPLTVKTIQRTDLPHTPYGVSFVDQYGKQIGQQQIAGPPQVSKVENLILGDNAALKWNWAGKTPLPGARFELVTTRSAARKIAAQLPKPLQASAFKNVKFTREAAIIAYLGEAPNGGYAVDIHSVQIDGSGITVRVSRRAPRPGEVNLMVLSYPMDIKSFAKSNLPKAPYTVRFIDQTGAEIAATSPRDRNVVYFHTVEAGETFWQIAWKYGASVEDLLRWNKMTTRDSLQIGQVLRIESRNSK